MIVKTQLLNSSSSQLQIMYQYQTNIPFSIIGTSTTGINYYRTGINTWQHEQNA
jgi:hypothetical protein